MIGLTFSGLAQGNYEFDNYEIGQVTYEKLDTFQIKNILQNPKIESLNQFNKGIKDVFSYREYPAPNSDDRVKIAYKLKNKKYWISFPTPLKDLTIPKMVNIDKKGSSELIVGGRFGYYGSGIQNEFYYTLIFSIDSIPTLLFKAIDYCSEESFGDRQNNGEGAYFYEYDRKIEIQEGQITIGVFDKEKYPDWCPITNFPAGTYKLVDDEFILKEK